MQCSQNVKVQTVMMTFGRSFQSAANPIAERLVRIDEQKELWSLFSQKMHGKLKVSIGKPPVVGSEMHVLMSSPAVLRFMTHFCMIRRRSQQLPHEGATTVEELWQNRPSNCTSNTELNKFICLRYNNGTGQTLPSHQPLARPRRESSTDVAGFMELFASSAILSSEALKKGFQTFAIDYELGRFATKSKFFCLIHRRMRPGTYFQKCITTEAQMGAHEPALWYYVTGREENLS